MRADVAEVSVPEQSQTISRRRFLIRGSIAFAGALGLYSAEIARHELSVVTQELQLEGLPASFAGFRIVQISDIHFDEYTEPSFLRRVVAQVNDLRPDLVMLTGDYISMGPLSLQFARRAMERCAEVLQEIRCPQRFAAMGNHDAALGEQYIGPILADVRIPLLINEHVPIYRDGDRVWLCATHDPVTHVPDLDATIPAKPDAPVLLISHGPDYADTVVAHPRGKLVSAMFSGHTHGGQVRFPLLPPLHLPEGGEKYVEGLFRLGRMQLYVNRGIGAVGVPFRLNCPPEITAFTLRSA
jgi:predicted MPP superfamily phosphohydrolase